MPAGKTCLVLAIGVRIRSYVCVCAKCVLSECGARRSDEGFVIAMFLLLCWFRLTMAAFPGCPGVRLLLALVVMLLHGHLSEANGE